MSESLDSQHHEIVCLKTDDFLVSHYLIPLPLPFAFLLVSFRAPVKKAIFRCPVKFLPARQDFFGREGGQAGRARTTGEGILLKDRVQSGSRSKVAKRRFEVWTGWCHWATCIRHVFAWMNTWARKLATWHPFRAASSLRKWRCLGTRWTAFVRLSIRSSVRPSDHAHFSLALHGPFSWSSLNVGIGEHGLDYNRANYI